MADALSQEGEQRKLLGEYVARHMTEGTDYGVIPGTKNKTLKRNPDGSLTLYAGAKSPGKDKESNWLPAPGGTFSLYVRAYWGKQAILDGSWQPPVIRVVN